MGDGIEGRIQSWGDVMVSNKSWDFLNDIKLLTFRIAPERMNRNNVFLSCVKNFGINENCSK